MAGLSWLLPVLAGCVTGVDGPPPPRDDLGELGAFVRAAWQGEQGESGPPGIAPAVNVILRAGGGRLADVWESGGPTREQIARAIDVAKSGMAATKRAEADVIELAIVGDVQRYGHRLRDRRLHANYERGMRGVHISYRGIDVWYGPHYQINTNRRIDRIYEVFGAANKAAKDSVETAAVVESFAIDHILVPLDGGPAVRLERGNIHVPVAAVDRASIGRFANKAAQWMAANVRPDGGLTYAYYPSAARESANLNVLRRWLAVTALNRAGLWDASRRAIDHGLARFYREADGLGLIEHDGKVKLGAVALAAMAIHGHPERDRWQDAYEGLLRTVDHLWNANGAFRTFLMPPGRDDNQNFYPGEALYLWAQIYGESGDPRLLERIMTSFAYYRDWHLGVDPASGRARRNPAFVPWHSQAYYRLWRETGDHRLADFVFAMNDWLIKLQQGEGDVAYRDMAGRFYKEGGAYGPPHASSTAAYLEGLVDALRLAEAVGDGARAARYERAIRHGFRSLMQLQFADDIDTYYVGAANRRYVDGGLRTTVYDNRIRVDNVAHGLAAALKYLAKPAS